MLHRSFWDVKDLIKTEGQLMVHIGNFNYIYYKINIKGKYPILNVKAIIQI